MKNKKIWLYALLFAIVFGGFLLRFVNINHTPPGVYPDEAVNGIDAINANNSGNYQLFYPANFGREGLFMNLIALCFKLFGISVLTLKLPAILFGTFTVLGTYLLTKEMFKNEKMALISSFLVAVSYWALNFSRISFRANMLPFILVFSFWLFFKALHTEKKYYYALAGFVFGIGIHTYIAWRIAPLILVAFLLILMLFRKKFLKEHWQKIAIYLVFSIIAAAPMFYTFYAHPEYFDSRSDSVSVFSPKMNNGDLVGTVFKSVSLSLLKYNFWGDQNWRHNYPPYPLLDVLSGIAFLFGFIYSLIRSFKALYLRFFKKIRDPGAELYIFLVIWFVVMLAPEFLTAEGNPHALRSIGTLPVVFIFAAIAFNYFIEQAKKHNLLFQKTVSILIILSLLSIGLFNSIKYHVFWAGKIETARAFEKVDTAVANYLKTLPSSQEKYVITGSMQRIPMQVFNQETVNLTYLYPGEIDQINPKNPKNFIIIMTDRNDELINAIRTRFPNLELQEHSEKVQEFSLSFYTLN